MALTKQQRTKLLQNDKFYNRPIKDVPIEELAANIVGTTCCWFGAGGQVGREWTQVEKLLAAAVQRMSRPNVSRPRITKTNKDYWDSAHDGWVENGVAVRVNENGERIVDMPVMERLREGCKLEFNVATPCSGRSVTRYNYNEDTEQFEEIVEELGKLNDECP